MDDTAKYLIHASITADGVVERSDVVGAIFGQTEGLLGDDLDLRDLQQSSKVGRIDVEIGSEHGESRGRITIASSLDKVETSILAASLETISRVGPCRASVTVTDIEDVRQAKRREVVERAKELLAESFDDSVMTSAELLEEVRESARVEDIAEYRGLPAGPRVTDSDAIIVVEGRADVLTLLKYGIKNAVAVEGTNVPGAVAELTGDRTVTAFLDGDRGGELILRELAQVGDVDYVAFAAEGRSVEDLSRDEVLAALRQKVPFESLPEDGDLRTAVAEGPDASPREESRRRETTDPSVAPAPARESADRSGDADVGSDAADPNAANANAESDAVDADADPAPADATAETDGAGAVEAAVDADFGRRDADGESADARVDAPDAPGAVDEAPPGPTTLDEHAREVVGEGRGRVRLLDDDFETVAEADAEATFDEIAGAEAVPYAVVIDGEATQRVVDVAAQRGVKHLIARSTGEYVKKPVDVRVRTLDQLSDSDSE